MKTVELTVQQKKAIIEYVLGDPGKGLFEDCDEFCTQEVEDNVDGYKDAVYDFVNELREKTLSEL